MQTEHPNIDLIALIDTTDIPGCADLFQPDVVWYFFNPKAPELAGAYRGIDGITRFFDDLLRFSEGKFTISPRVVWTVGDELVVVQSRNGLSQGDVAMTFDVVVVWRIIDGKISEVWDIPAVHTAQMGADLTSVLSPAAASAS